MNAARSIAWLMAAVLIAGCSQKATDQTSAEQSDSDLVNRVQAGQNAPTTAATDAAAVTPAETAAPRIELQTTSYDMGVVPGDQIAVQKMKIYNRGNAPLKIEKVSTSCGCTTGEIETPLIAPGGEGNLIIRVDPKKIPGFYANKVLTISNNDPTNSHPTVNVVTRVQPEIEFDPEILELGSIDIGSEISRTVRIRQVQDAPTEVSAVVFQRDPPYMHATLAPVSEAEWKTKGKKEWMMTVTIDAVAPPDQYDEWIIVSTNLKRTPQLPYKFKLNLAGPYEFAPRTVAIRSLVPGDKRSDVLTLTGKEAINIIEVTNSNQSVNMSYRTTDKPNVVAFDLVVPERTPTPSLRDTWKVVFETGGKRFEDSVAVVLILAREN